MASTKRIEVIGLMTIFVMVMMISISSKAMAQQSCMNVIISMASCLDFVSGSSKAPTPSCCSSLANVVQTNPRCLCVVLNGGGSSLGININQTTALQLPDACKVKTPPVSRCNEANGPAMSPLGSSETSAAGPIGASDSSTSPSVIGSKATETSGTPSSGSVTKKNVNMVGFLVLVAAYVSKLNYF